MTLKCKITKRLQIGGGSATKEKLKKKGFAVNIPLLPKKTVFFFQEDNFSLATNLRFGWKDGM